MPLIGVALVPGLTAETGVESLWLASMTSWPAHVAPGTVSSASLSCHERVLKKWSLAVTNRPSGPLGCGVWLVPTPFHQV